MVQLNLPNTVFAGVIACRRMQIALRKLLVAFAPRHNPLLNPYYFGRGYLPRRFRALVVAIPGLFRGVAALCWI
jgi:hypothetical protein